MKMVPKAAVAAVHQSEKPELSYSWNYGRALGKPVEIRYFFSDVTLPAFKDEVSRASAWTELQKATVREVMGSFASVANVTFVEVASAQEAHTSLFIAESMNAAGKAYMPQRYATGTTDGDIVFLHSAFPDNGSNPYLAYHEIAHSLGMDHPNRQYLSGLGLDSNRLLSVTETTYFDHPYRIVESGNSFGADLYFHPSGPGVLDILALQEYYGPNLAYNSHDNVYTFPAQEMYYKVLWDGGGIDTVDLRDQKSGSIVSLVEGAFSSVGVRIPSAQLTTYQRIYATQQGILDRLYDGTENLVIAYGAVIENLLGSSYDDVLEGNVSSNRIEGGGGNDTITGGKGADTLSGGTGADTFQFLPGDSILGAPDLVTDFGSDDVIWLPGLSGVSFRSSETRYASVSDAVAGLSNDPLFKNSLVSFAVGETAYLFVNGAGTGVDFNGTLVRVPSGTSLKPAQVIANLAPSGTVSISGGLYQSQLLTASSLLSDADGVGPISYHWLSDGKPIPGAIGNSFQPTQMEVGHVLSVEARFIDGHGTPESVRSAGHHINNLNDAPAGPLKITFSGDGRSLWLDTSAVNDPEGIGYLKTTTWEAKRSNSASWEPVPGGTINGVLLPDYLVNQEIHVVSSYVDQWGSSETLSAFYGSQRNDLIVGSTYADYVDGRAGDDEIISSLGNDHLNGGSGIDVAIYMGRRQDYAVERSDGSWNISSLFGVEGNDIVVAVERLEFADTKWALDIDGIAGQAYRLYKAAFNRVPDPEGVGYWMHFMGLGVSLIEVANAFTASKEYMSLYANSSHDVLVRTYYRNILGREPDKAGADFWVDVLKKGSATVPEVLVAISESLENVTVVGSQIKNGFAYNDFAWFGA